MAGPAYALVNMGAGWQIPITGTCNGSGAVTVQSQEVDNGLEAHVDRIVIEAVSEAAGVCRMYRTAAEPQFFLGGSGAAASDIWEAPSPLVVDGSDFLVFAFSGLDPGAAVQVTIHQSLKARRLIARDGSLLAAN